MTPYEFVECFDRSGTSVPDPHERINLAVKFHSKIQFSEDGCWLWTASLNPAGYGYFNTATRHGLSGLAHRSLYACLVAPVSSELHLDHLCRNQRCVNPNHLEPVTPQENIVRMYEAKETCANGHPYRGSLRIKNSTQGWTRCSRCHADREKKRRETHDHISRPRLKELTHGN